MGIRTTLGGRLNLGQGSLGFEEIIIIKNLLLYHFCKYVYVDSMDKSDLKVAEKKLELKFISCIYAWIEVEPMRLWKSTVVSTKVTKML